jgi:putative ABC transport system permease protein
LTTYALNLKLTHPDDAQAFAYEHFQSNPLAVSTWEGLSSEDAILLQDGHGVIQPGAVLLALLAIASAAVLVGRRLSEYSCRVGLLKAVGATPSVVAATFLAENLMLALFAAVVGLVAGWLASPLVIKPGAALIGSAGSPRSQRSPQWRSSPWHSPWRSRRSWSPPSAHRAAAPSPP